MALEVVRLSKELIGYDSVSQRSNVALSSYVAEVLKSQEFAVEELPYTDANGVDKLSIVGKLGKGTGGLSLMSHDDVVPATNAHARSWTASASVRTNGSGPNRSSGSRGFPVGP